MAVAGVHPEVRVCGFSASFLANCIDAIRHPPDSPLPPEKVPNGVGARVSSGVAPSVASAPSAGAALNKAPTTRDPKSRARSREYLKQCLQEISYLTSPQAMNPLPNRPLISNPNPSMGLGGNVMNPSAPGGVGMGGMTGSMGGVGQGQGITQGQGPLFDAIYNGRPRKQLPESAGPGISGVGVGGVPGKEFPMLGSVTGAGTTTGIVSGPGSAPPSSGSLERPSQLSGPGMYQQQQQGSVQAQPQQSQENQLQRNLAPSQPPQSQTQPPQQQQDGIGQTPAPRQEGDAPKPVTMIFRPDDGGEWKEKLRSSYEQQVQQWRDNEEEEPEEVGEEEDEADSVGVVDEADGESTKLWRAKRTLRKCVFSLSHSKVSADLWFSSHLDAVRALAFHPTELCLATGGDDCTVKIWRMDVASLASSTCVRVSCSIVYCSRMLSQCASHDRERTSAYASRSFCCHHTSCALPFAPTAVQCIP